MSVTLTLKDEYGDLVEVTTEHAHAAPRGEVYLDLTDTLDDDSNAIAALTPETARLLASYLIGAAEDVEPKPSPADECGVSGGCGACPLVEFCGDRDPRLAAEPAFEFDRRGGDFTIETAVYQAIGAASTCWESLSGTGVFDDVTARAIGEALLAEIRSTDPDAPDVDPAEPKPEGGGCCGGGCCG